MGALARNTPFDDGAVVGGELLGRHDGVEFEAVGVDDQVGERVT
jgi:hypothetical protein